MKNRDLQGTICAISTAPGVGGIAVIRVSGPAAFSIVDSIYSRDLIAQEHSTMSVGSLHTGDQEVDEVVIGKFIGPSSFTGEDVIEISCHGSIYIQQRIVALLIAEGAEPAGPGEFTQRAFLNGKMDLSQAEAVADLIASESAAAHRLALQQMKGGYSNEIAQLRSQLTEFAALIELELDFSEEDVEFADRTRFKQLVDTILFKVSDLIASFKLGNVMKRGVPVAIIGAPNSGKSTLLNALLREERAIVSDIAGTTRDAIEDTRVIDDITFRFIDTAGMRSTEDIIESKGIDLALKRAEQASIVIKLIDSQQMGLDEESRMYVDYFKELGWQDDDRTLVVHNKVDLLDSLEDLGENQIGISAMTGDGIEQLQVELLRRTRNTYSGNSDIIVTNARHLAALERVHTALTAVDEAMRSNLPSDLMAIDIRKALHYLGEVTGEVSTDDLLGTIFSRFCIGK